MVDRNGYPTFRQSSFAAAEGYIIPLINIYYKMIGILVALGGGELWKAPSCHRESYNAHWGKVCKMALPGGGVSNAAYWS